MVRGSDGTLSLVLCQLLLQLQRKPAADTEDLASQTEAAGANQWRFCLRQPLNHSACPELSPAASAARCSSWRGDVQRCSRWLPALPQLSQPACTGGRAGSRGEARCKEGGEEAQAGLAAAGRRAWQQQEQQQACGSKAARAPLVDLNRFNCQRACYRAQPCPCTLPTHTELRIISRRLTIPHSKCRRRRVSAWGKHQKASLPTGAVGAAGGAAAGHWAVGRRQLGSDVSLMMCC